MKPRAASNMMVVGSHYCLIFVLLPGLPCSVVCARGVHLRLVVAGTLWFVVLQEERQVILLAKPLVARPRKVRAVLIRNVVGHKKRVGSTRYTHLKRCTISVGPDIVLWD